ncbi:unnamed protein product [Durusdinium trenchii]|uniref:Uncharacterized protein n=1 Tax=Durusdinium trenchii TaxID=1381693 RepID=A0ABP0RSZ2_9DINO
MKLCVLSVLKSQRHFSWPNRTLSNAVRLTIQWPMVDGMPAIAVADPSVMPLKNLLSHGREASSRWRIQHPPFWETFFQRLRELKDQVGVVEAVQILCIVTKLRLVDLYLVEMSVEKILQADDEEVLDLPQRDLAEAAEALAIIRPEETNLLKAMAVLLRVLAARAHRLRAGHAVKLLTAAAEARSSSCHDFAEAFCRSLVERQDAPSQDIAMAAEATAKLVTSGLYRLEPHPCGLELLLQHAARRVQSFTLPRLRQLVDAGMSLKSPASIALQQLLHQQELIAVERSTAEKKSE